MGFDFDWSKTLTSGCMSLSPLCVELCNAYEFMILSIPYKFNYLKLR